MKYTICDYCEALSHVNLSVGHALLTNYWTHATGRDAKTVNSARRTEGNNSAGKTVRVGERKSVKTFFTQTDSLVCFSDTRDTHKQIIIKLMPSTHRGD